MVVMSWRRKAHSQVLTSPLLFLVCILMCTAEAPDSEAVPVLPPAHATPSQ